MTNDDQWRSYSLPIGEAMKAKGVLEEIALNPYLLFVTDADNVSGNHAYFRNIRLIDYSH